GNIAAAWASMMALGVDGYMERARELMATTDKLKQGVAKIQGLYVLGEPVMTCFSVGSSDPDVDIQAVADDMGKKGWHMERQQNPSCLHCSILPHHVRVSDSLLKDLEDSTQEVKKNKSLAKEGTAAMYGMIATIPDKAIVQDFLVEFFSEVYK
ncbi:sphingosine-1-phosphate lyase-like, partial [Mizuhopecten yessoensis]